MDFIKPKCKLVGTDGNVFCLAGKVMAALRKAGYPEKSKEFSDALNKCPSYVAAWCVIHKYIEIE